MAVARGSVVVAKGGLVVAKAGLVVAKEGLVVAKGDLVMVTWGLGNGLVVAKGGLGSLAAGPLGWCWGVVRRNLAALRGRRLEDWPTPKPGIRLPRAVTPSRTHRRIGFLLDPD